MQYEEPTNNSIGFWPGAKEWLGINSDLAIDVDIERDGHCCYSAELILRCNAMAMMSDIKNLQAVIEHLQARIDVFEATEELRRQESGQCCVCTAAVAVRILQNCGCRVLCDSHDCYTRFKYAVPRIRTCPYCRTVRIRRDISAPLHF